MIGVRTKLALFNQLIICLIPVWRKNRFLHLCGDVKLTKKQDFVSKYLSRQNLNRCVCLTDGGSCLTTGQGSRCTTWWRGSSAWRAATSSARRRPWSSSPCWRRTSWWGPSCTTTVSSRLRYCWVFFYASRSVCFIRVAMCFQLSKQHALFAYLLLISFILCKHEKTAESVLPFPRRLPLLQQRFTIAMAWWKFAWTWGFIEQLCNRYLNAWQQQTWWQVLKSFSEAPIDFWGVETSTWAFTRWLNR